MYCGYECWWHMWEVDVCDGSGDSWRVRIGGGRVVSEGVSGWVEWIFLVMVAEVVVEVRRQ